MRFKEWVVLYEVGIVTITNDFLHGGICVADVQFRRRAHRVCGRLDAHIIVFVVFDAGICIAHQFQFAVAVKSCIGRGGFGYPAQQIALCCALKHIRFGGQRQRTIRDVLLDILHTNRRTQLGVCILQGQRIGEGHIGQVRIKELHPVLGFQLDNSFPQHAGFRRDECPERGKLVFVPLPALVLHQHIIGQVDADLALCELLHLPHGDRIQRGCLPSGEGNPILPYYAGNVAAVSRKSIQRVVHDGKHSTCLRRLDGGCTSIDTQIGGITVQRPHVCTARTHSSEAVMRECFRADQHTEAGPELAERECSQQIIVIDEGGFQPRGRTQPVMQVGVSVDDLRQLDAAA